MKYKGILLDIDNTLYNYKKTHTLAKSAVINYCVEKFSIKEEFIEDAYNKARSTVHLELAETASSHNRLLYFQKMLEILEINALLYALDIYNTYWDTFLENLMPFENIYLLLEKYKGRICLVTDLTAHIQYRKIKKLKLDKYCNCIVTSEEAGREKPHPYMFMLGLKKLNLTPKDVCMIGDSYKKDILGASNLGINTIWLNHENKEENIKINSIKEVKSFEEILELV
ncbi:HAD family hydrolase [Halarcobacter sp.]|uniref:HAD family hydrolase n=1 Tax=Halarcobacter sp. TaxID=2321133 RepID=UPI002AA75DCF|nr:HAD family hydrolase [Halarcobacter sp.]